MKFATTQRQMRYQQEIKFDASGQNLAALDSASFLRKNSLPRVLMVAGRSCENRNLSRELLSLYLSLSLNPSLSSFIPVFFSHNTKSSSERSARGRKCVIKCDPGQTVRYVRYHLLPSLVA